MEHKIAQDELGAITIPLLPAEEAILHMLFDFVYDCGQRNFPVRAGYRGDWNVMQLRCRDKRANLPTTGPDDDPIMHLRALDELGFLAFHEKPAAPSTGSDLPASVTVLPPAMLRVAHRRQWWLRRAWRVTRLGFYRQLDFLAVLLAFIAVLISVLAAIGILPGQNPVTLP